MKMLLMFFRCTHMDLMHVILWLLVLHSRQHQGMPYRVFQQLPKRVLYQKLKGIGTIKSNKRFSCSYAFLSYNLSTVCVHTLNGYSSAALTICGVAAVVVVAITGSSVEPSTSPNDCRRVDTATGRFRCSLFSTDSARITVLDIAVVLCDKYND